MARVALDNVQKSFTINQFHERRNCVYQHFVSYLQDRVAASDPRQSGRRQRAAQQRSTNPHCRHRNVGAQEGLL